MRKSYNYTICKVPSAEYFYKQCSAIERHIQNLTKDKLLQDVDGSLFQVYRHDKGEIKVCNDYAIGCLYLETDFDLTEFFSK